MDEGDVSSRADGVAGERAAAPSPVGGEPSATPGSGGGAEVGDPGALDLAAQRGTLERLAGVLDDVESALRRLDNATYGVCAECGQPIEAGRLEDDPTVRSCAHHPELSEQQDPGLPGPGTPRGSP